VRIGFLPHFSLQPSGFKFQLSMRPAHSSFPLHQLQATLFPHVFPRALLLVMARIKSNGSKDSTANLGFEAPAMRDSANLPRAAILRSLSAAKDNQHPRKRRLPGGRIVVADFATAQIERRPNP